MLQVSAPSARQFACIRILLGGYVAASLAAWIPHAELLLQARELVPLPDTPFPSVLEIVSSAALLRFLLASACAASLAYALGIWRRALAVVLWYAWACLVERVFIVSIPSDGYVGWLLLASALVPGGEALRSSEVRPGWRVPRELVQIAWVVAAVSYTASGIDKLFSETWREGNALGAVMSSAIARPWAAALAPSIPDGWWQLATWSALALECGHGALCAFRATRRWAWLGAVGMHLCVLASMQIESVSLAMLLFHGFLFDRAWLPSWVGRTSQRPLARTLLARRLLPRESA